jgi:hypothetical protein
MFLSNFVFVTHKLSGEPTNDLCKKIATNGAKHISIDPSICQFVTLTTKHHRAPRPHHRPITTGRDASGVGKRVFLARLSHF